MMYKSSIYFLIALAISVAMYPLTKLIARQLNCMDQPGERKIHSKATPRAGGIMIFTAFIVTYFIAYKDITFYSAINFSLVFFIIALTSSFLLGLYDDIKGIKATKKLILQIIIGTLVAYSGLRITSIPFLPNIALPIFWSYTATILWVAAFINAVNLIDGMDGLASGILIIALGFTFAISIIDMNYFVVVISAITLGATLGFFIFNYNPAKIFLGDCGSYFLGCLYAMLSLMNRKASMSIMLAIPLVLLLLPIADVIYIMVRRTKQKQNIFKADKNHIHHRLAKLGFSVRQITTLVYLVCIVFGLVSLLIFLTGGKYGIIFVLLIISLVLICFSAIRMLEKKIKKI